MNALALIASLVGGIGVNSTGADGALVVMDTVAGSGWDAEIDLGDPGTWGGVYDATNWAVAFNYTSVHIQSGARVRFINHPKRAPVVWLVQGDVLIEGVLSLDGEDATNTVGDPLYPEPGPGGFRGGRGSPVSILDDSSCGFGPGGGFWDVNDDSQGGSGASHETAGVAGQGGSAQVAPTYGDPALIQLIGGSGGAGGRHLIDERKSGTGGAGGGAILVATDGNIVVSGDIAADGGDGAGSNFDPKGGGGSGGSIRLVGSSVSLLAGSEVRAYRGTGPTGNGPNGGDGGDGRIRIEAPIPLGDIALGGVVIPMESTGTVGTIWPPAPTGMSLRIDSVDTIVAPTDPAASLGVELVPPDVEVPTTTGSVAIVIEAREVPTDWEVWVRVTYARNKAEEFQASYQSGVQALSTWSVMVDFDSGYSALQARAFDPTP